MDRVKGQASPDFVMSAMIFSLAALFVFFHMTRTYYSRVWEVSKIGETSGAQNLAMFLVSESGNWEDNPFESSSIGFGGEEINQTRMDYFFGMAYQEVQKKLVLSEDFRIEVWRLPNMGITSDIKELYINETVDVQFETTEDAELDIVLVGTQGVEGYSYWNESSGRYHEFTLDLPAGVYSLKALAISGEDYGAYEAAFRVVR